VVFIPRILKLLIMISALPGSCFDKASCIRFIIDPKSGVFVPPHRARGIIARTVIYMLEEYPDLVDNVDAIIDCDALSQWSHLKITDYERRHHEFATIVHNLKNSK
jgi:endonuclease I